MKKSSNTTEHLGFKEICAVSLMLFAMFFGAGNMIFPPTLGAAAGENVFTALLGYVMGDAGLAILGIAAVSLVGQDLHDLGNLVGKKFAVVFALAIYLLIGPLFALPRTATVSFEITIVPFLSGESKLLASVIFTSIFFFLAYYLSRNPKKIVEIVGKILTPLLLFSIALIFITALLNPYGEIGQATGGYQDYPFFTGFIEGYNAVDGPAGLAFAAVVITAIRGIGLRSEKAIAKYTIISGFGSGVVLAIVYFALAYLGAHSGALGTFENGGQMLIAIANTTTGKIGVFLLSIAVLLACITTAIGLITAFGEYISVQYPRISYQAAILATTLFSLVISNVGLTTLIKFSLPVLLIIYPVTIIISLQAFFAKLVGNRRGFYWLGLLFTFIVSVILSLDSLNISLGFLSSFVQALPLYDAGVAWFLPAVVGSLLGLLIPAKK